MKSKIVCLGCYLLISIAAFSQSTVTTTGGTQNAVPKFSTSTSIVNSQIVDNGARKAVTLGNMNGTFYIDGVNYATNDTGLHNAVNDAMTQGGGVVVIPSGTNISLTSPLQVGSSSSKSSVILYIATGATLTIAVTGGADAIQLFDGCGIRGDNGIPIFSSTTQTSRITVSASANVNSVVTNGDKSGHQQGLFLENVHLTGANNQNVATAMVYLSLLYSGTYIRNVTIDGFPSIGLYLLGVTGEPFGVIHLENLVVNGNGNTNSGARPVVFQAAAGTTGGIGNVDCFHCDFEHAGAGKAILEITGNAGGTGSLNTNQGITFHGLYLEATPSVQQIGIEITDSHDVYFYGVEGAGDPSNGLGTCTGGSDLVEIKQTASNRTGNIVFYGLEMFNWRYAVNDLIKSTCYSNNSISRYTFQGLDITD